MLIKQVLLSAAVFFIGLSSNLYAKVETRAASKASRAPSLGQGSNPFRYQLYTTNVLAWASGQRQGPVQDHRSAMTGGLENLLKGATRQVNLAIYGIQSQTWAFDTIQRLQERGLEIRALVDQKSGDLGDWAPGNFTYPDTAQLASLLPLDAVVPDQNPTGKVRTSSIMHNKFVTIDGQYLWTGSSNLSHTCMGDEYNANVSIMIDSPALVALYEAEFDEMHTKKNFSSRKDAHGRDSLHFDDGTEVSVYFSPADDPVASGIIPLIEEARKTLDIGMFYLTHRDVVAALKAARDRGVQVRLIYDAVAAAHPSSPHKDLRAAGILVRVENWGGKMHMKTAIADDRHVVIGSMNWTDAGNASNDENTLIIRHNPRLGGELRDYFDQLWDSLTANALLPDPRAESPQSINSCFDGIDNDHDGLVDSQEALCRNAQEM